MKKAKDRENVISFYLLMTFRKTLHNMLKDVILKPFRKCVVVVDACSSIIQMIMMQNNVFEWKICLMSISHKTADDEI